LNEFDAFTIGGTATLSGLIDVELINGFTPSAGASFNILTASSITNNGLALTPEAAALFTLNVGSSSVLLQAMGAGVAGDLNGDGLINFGDLTPFVKALTDIPGYEAMFPGLDRVERCDVSGDGLCNFGDLTPFANLLTGGPGTGTAVPEPTSILLVVMALLGVASRRQLS
jgi:hypothetical protein